MTAGERSTVADQLVEALRLAASGATVGDQVAIAAIMAGKVIATGAQSGTDRGQAAKTLVMLLNAQLTLESVGEHRPPTPIGRFSSEDE